MFIAVFDDSHRSKNSLFVFNFHCPFKKTMYLLGVFSVVEQWQFQARTRSHHLESDVYHRWVFYQKDHTRTGMVSFMSHFQNVSVSFTCKIKISTLKIPVRKDE